MPHRSIRILLCLAIAIAVVAGTLLSIAHAPMGHNAYVAAQAEALRHSQLAVAMADHGHAHEEGDPGERMPGHVHGHNSADHIHETANLVGGISLSAPQSARVEMPYELHLLVSGIIGALDRPPRSVVA